MSYLRPVVQRVGVATTRKHGTTVMFQRLRIHLSRKYRVYWVPGDPRYDEYDPVAFSDKFKTVQEYPVMQTEEQTPQEEVETLSDEVLLQAGHYLYSSHYADLYEEHGGSYGPGAAIEACVSPAPQDKLLPLMRELESQLAAAWGRSVPEVCRLLGLDTQRGQVDVFYYTIMACEGHGISLSDDHTDAIQRLEDTVGGAFDCSPFDTENMALDDLAYEQLEIPQAGNWAIFNEKGEMVDSRFLTEESARVRALDYGPEYSIKQLPEAVDTN